VYSRSAGLALLLVACGDPFAAIAKDPGTDPDLVHFERLREGQRLIVDFHSQGCFMSSDAHLVFEVRNGQIDLSGTSSVSGLVDADPADLGSRQLTVREVQQLDNMLDLYRREEHQTYCWSTGKHTTTLRLTDQDGSTGAEHHVTDGCIEYRLLKDGDLTEMRPREDILTFGTLTRPVLEQLFAQHQALPNKRLKLAARVD
jgi:hypothetical protein